MKYEILNFTEEDYKKISENINSKYNENLNNIFEIKFNTFLFFEEKKKLIIKEKANLLNLIKKLRFFNLKEITNFLDFLQDLKIKKSFISNCFMNNNTSFFYLSNENIIIRDIKSNASRFATNFDIKLILDECYYGSNLSYEQLVEMLKRQNSGKYIKEIFKNIFMIQKQRTFEYLYLDDDPNFFLSAKQQVNIELNNKIIFHNTKNDINKKKYSEFNLYKKNNSIYFDFNKKEIITKNDLYLLHNLKFSDKKDKFLGAYKGFYIFIEYSDISYKHILKIYNKKSLINGKIFVSLEIEKGSILEFIDYKSIIDYFLQNRHIKLSYYNFPDKYAFMIGSGLVKEIRTKLEDYSYIYGIINKIEEQENFVSIRYKQEFYIIKTDSKFNYLVSGDEVENIIENNFDELKKESRKNDFLLNL